MRLLAEIRAAIEKHASYEYPMSLKRRLALADELVDIAVELGADSDTPFFAEPERDVNPEEKWLEVWKQIGNAVAEEATDDDVIEALVSAVRGLYLLWEPPSVRNRRQEQADQR